MRNFLFTPPSPTRLNSARWGFFLTLWLCGAVGSFWPRTAWAQSNLVPLGTAAQFGLLSGGYLTASAPGTVVQGVLGATAGFSGVLEADNGPYWPGGAPATLTAAALTDLAAARATCAALPDQHPLASLTNQTLGTGTYALAGNVTLAPGTMIRLVGDSATRIVFNIAGSLTVGFGAGVSLNGIRPGQVFWNINGAFVANGPAALSGIILGGSTASLSGRWSGDAALLVAGNINLTQLSLDGESAPAYFSAAPLLAWRRAAAAAPATTTACQNLIANGDCEQFVNIDPNRNPPSRMGNVGSRQANRGSEAAFWQNPNEESPDYFRPGGIIRLGVPNNEFNGYLGNAAHSQQSYLGIYSKPQLAGGLQRREYLWQRLGTPLAAGQRYYAEFYALRARNSRYQMQALGLAIRAANVADPYEATGVIVTGTPPNTTTTTTSSVMGNGTLPVAAGDHDASFNSTTVWSRTAGCYLAQGGERDIILGNFRDDAASGFVDVTVNASNDGAYYFIDDISLFPFPKPIIVSAGDANCRLRYTLDMDCLLPASSNATYAWFLNVNGQLQPQPLQTGTLPLVVTPLATTTYTLVTTVPGLGGANPTEDQRDLTITPFVVLAGTLTGGANYPAATYYVPDAGGVTFTQGTYTFAPGSLVLGEGLKSTIVVGTNATLLAQATTFTAACNQMWAGISVKYDAKGFCIGRPGDNLTSPLPGVANYSQQAPVSEISHAFTGVRWEAPPTVPVRLLHTRLLHNLVGLSTNTGASTALVHSGAAIMNNQFDSNSSQFKTAETDNYTHVAVNLDGWNYQNTPIAGNRFLRCVVGILLRTPTTASKVTIADHNEFGALMVGIRAQDPGAALIVSGNRFVYGYPSSYPLSAALMTRFNTYWSGVATGLTNKVTGVYVYGSLSNTTGTLTIQANDFGWNSFPNTFPVTWAYPQRGVVVDLINSP